MAYAVIVLALSGMKFDLLFFPVMLLYNIFFGYLRYPQTDIPFLFFPTRSFSFELDISIGRRQVSRFCLKLIIRRNQDEQ